MKVKAVLLIVSILLATPAFGEELTQEKRSAIKELMDITGAAAMGDMLSEAFVQQMTSALQNTKPKISPKAFIIIKEEVNAVIREEMIETGTFYEQICPIYHKYLTFSDIRGLITFYQTPLGKKIITVMPSLARESMIAGQTWGQSLGAVIQRRINERFEEEGIN